jgi:hypothetical protein
MIAEELISQNNKLEGLIRSRQAVQRNWKLSKEIQASYSGILSFLAKEKRDAYFWPNLH